MNLGLVNFNSQNVNLINFNSQNEVNKLSRRKSRRSKRVKRLAQQWFQDDTQPGQNAKSFGIKVSDILTQIILILPVVCLVHAVVYYLVMMIEYPHTKWDLITKNATAIQLWSPPPQIIRLKRWLKYSFKIVYCCGYYSSQYLYDENSQINSGQWTIQSIQPHYQRNRGINWTQRFSRALYFGTQFQPSLIGFDFTQDFDLINDEEQNRSRQQSLILEQPQIDFFGSEQSTRPWPQYHYGQQDFSDSLIDFQDQTWLYDQQHNTDHQQLSSISQNHPIFSSFFQGSQFNYSYQNYSPQTELLRINQQFHNHYNQPFQQFGNIFSWNYNESISTSISSNQTAETLSDRINQLPQKQQQLQYNMSPPEKQPKKQRFLLQDKTTNCQCQSKCRKTQLCRCYRKNQPCGPGCGCKGCPDKIFPSRKLYNEEYSESDCPPDDYSFEVQPFQFL